MQTTETIRDPKMLMSLRLRFVGSCWVLRSGALLWVVLAEIGGAQGTKFDIPTWVPPQAGSCSQTVRGSGQQDC